MTFFSSLDSSETDPPQEAIAIEVATAFTTTDGFRRTTLTEHIFHCIVSRLLEAMGQMEPPEDLAGGYADRNNPESFLIPLAGGLGAVARIDAEDYPLVRAYRWRMGTGRYAVASQTVSGVTHRFCMHRLVLMLGRNDGRSVDHINHDTLDNVKGNLRLCEHHQNLWNTRKPTTNTSGHKNVHFVAAENRWVASVMVQGKVHSVRCLTKEAAATWARVLREQHHGEFACHG